ncbi:MAG: type III pantothenate kinase [Chitinispirillia bacterium]|jgi:type III pantothenate kinase
MDTVLAVDIGNTRTKIGIIDIHNLICKKKSIVNSSENKSIFHTVNTFLKQYPEIKTNPLKISSTIKSKVRDIQSFLNSRRNIYRIDVLRYHSHLPIKSSYIKPENLGTDRIANCLFGLKKYPGTNCIIISAGTATTIDILSNNCEHLGGYILPGIQTKIKSLYSNTADLPMVNTADNQYSHIFPPNSTESGIYNGVVLEQSGGISFIIKKVLETIPGDYKILVCGGEWKFIKPYIKFSFFEYPDLTLIGTGLFE